MIHRSVGFAVLESIEKLTEHVEQGRRCCDLFETVHLHAPAAGRHQPPSRTLLEEVVN